MIDSGGVSRGANLRPQRNPECHKNIPLHSECHHSVSQWCAWPHFVTVDQNANVAAVNTNFDIPHDPHTWKSTELTRYFHC